MEANTASEKQGIRNVIVKDLGTTVSAEKIPVK